MLTVVPVILPNSTPRIGGDILLGSRVTGTGRDDRRVFHGPMFLENIHHLGHGGFFLPNGHINTKHIRVFLIDDGIHTNGRFPDLPVSDNQLTLSPSNGGHGVNGLDARVHGLLHRLAGNHARCHHLDSSGFGSVNGTLAVQGLSHGVDHPAENRIPHRNFCDSTGSLDRIPFPDFGVVSHDGNTHIVLFQIQTQAIDAARELQHLHGHGIFHAIYTGNTVTDR